ncbi:MAG: hypothetical protein RLZZ234_649 [Candidatus Parcubacteria bacterium]
MQTTNYRKLSKAPLCATLVIFATLFYFFLFSPQLSAQGTINDGRGGTFNDGSGGTINDGRGGTINDGFTPTKGNRESSKCGTGGSGTTLCNPLSFGSFGEFFIALIDILILFAIPIIVLMIIYAGFLYVMARGSEEQVTKASRALTYAVLGGLLILGAELILKIIQGTVSQLTPF